MTQSDANQSPNPNSLITGKLTGNFANSGPPARFWRPIGERIQWLAAKFPTQRNREFFWRNRELFSQNRELSRLNWEFKLRSARSTCGCRWRLSTPPRWLLPADAGAFRSPGPASNPPGWASPTVAEPRPWSSCDEQRPAGKACRVRDRPLARVRWPPRPPAAIRSRQPGWRQGRAG